MNDVDFPVARVLDGIDAAAAAGLPVKVNVVVKRGLNEGSILELARHFHGTGHTLRFIEYMDVGHTNGWRLDDVVPARGDRRGHRRRAAARAGRSRLPRGGRAALPLPRRRRRDRRHRVGHAAVLRRLHARAAVGGRPSLHLPLRRSRARSPQPRPFRRVRRGAGRHDRRHLDGPSRPVFRAPHRRDRRPAQGRDVLHRRLTAPAPTGTLESAVPWRE